jgi:predicted permease
MTSVLATEFNTAPQLVATIIFVSTAVSMVTLSLVLWLLWG